MLLTTLCANAATPGRCWLLHTRPLYTRPPRLPGLRPAIRWLLCTVCFRLPLPRRRSQVRCFDARNLYASWCTPLNPHMPNKAARWRENQRQKQETHRSSNAAPNEVSHIKNRLMSSHLLSLPPAAYAHAYFTQACLPPKPGIPRKACPAGSRGRPKFSSRSRITFNALRLRRYGKGAVASSRPTDGSRLSASDPGRGRATHTSVLGKGRRSEHDKLTSLEDLVTSESETELGR